MHSAISDLTAIEFTPKPSLPATAKKRQLLDAAHFGTDRKSELNKSGALGTFREHLWCGLRM